VKILIRDSHFGKSEKRIMMMMTSLVMLHLKFNLTVNLGDGYIYGSAYFGSKPFKINIQEALENKLILPSELQIESNLGYVLFETEKKRRVQCKIIDEAPDMILLYTDIQTLMYLTKDLPTTMRVTDEE
jgi:hypothetical protein